MGRTLDLRSTLPTAAEATARVDVWLRGRQAQGGDEVLVITGRGNQSVDRIAVVRPAVEKRLHLLQRQGVIAGFSEHTAGSFVVTLAPMAALLGAAQRRRGPPLPPPANPAALAALPADLRAALRQLALQSLEGLRAPATEAFIADEMQRAFARLTVGLVGHADLESRLRAAIRAALDEE
jgi:hypothetical protein